MVMERKRGGMSVVLCSSEHIQIKSWWCFVGEEDVWLVSEPADDGLEKVFTNTRGRWAWL